jgi:hypothetical protein
MNTTKRLQTNENYGEYINRRIEEIFADLAEEAGDQLAEEYGEDMPTGTLAFELMSKSIKLQKAWAKISSNS